MSYGHPKEEFRELFDHRATQYFRHKDNCSHKAQSGFSVVQALMSRINKHKKSKKQKKTQFTKKQKKKKKHSKSRMSKQQRFVQSMIQDLTRVHSTGGVVITTKEIKPMKIITTRQRKKQKKVKKVSKMVVKKTVKKKSPPKKKVVQKKEKKKSQKKKELKKKSQKKKELKKKSQKKKELKKTKTKTNKERIKKDDGRRCRYGGLVLRAGSTGKLHVGGRCRLCLCKVEKDSGLSLICRHKC